MGRYRLGLPRHFTSLRLGLQLDLIEDVLLLNHGKCALPGFWGKNPQKKASSPRTITAFERH